MTTATVAAPTGNQFGVLLAIFLVITFVTCVVLWVHEQRSDKQGGTIAEHTEQLATLAYQMPALLEFLGIEIPEPAADDSPEAESQPGDDAKTDEFPVAPPTVPDGMPLAVQSALIERPSPVPRGAEMVERTVNIGGTLQTFRIPAREDT